jgi:raffinose/stachyose/melibiose transport system substrate-binding protein
MKRSNFLRTLSMILLIAMTSVLLFGCASKETPPANNPPAGTTPTEQTPAEQTPATTEKIELRLLTPWTAGAAAYDQIEALMAKYKAESPNITIIHDALPTADARTKLTVEMAAGNPPDVSWCPLSYAREFIKDDMIIDWKPVFEDPRYPEFKQWFTETSLNFASAQDGRIMLAPQEGSIDGLFYNKELFQKYGW